MFEIKDKVVLITGGATGIGAATVRAFLDAGAKHVVFLDVKISEGKTLEEQINNELGTNKATFIKCDVTTHELDDAYNETLKLFNTIDVVVNNAGVNHDNPEAYEREILINLTALIKSSLTAYSFMRKDKGGNGGTIINISSVAALCICPVAPIYTATKSAVLQFSRSLGSEPHYSRSGVRVITICFGTTDTEMPKARNRRIDEETENDFFSVINSYPSQSVESAAQGVVRACERGGRASTWLVTSGRPAEDVSHRVHEAERIASQGVFD